MEAPWRKLQVEDISNFSSRDKSKAWSSVENICKHFISDSRIMQIKVDKGENIVRVKYLDCSLDYLRIKGSSLKLICSKKN